MRAKEEDGLEIQGKMRDLIAAMLNESSTNVARMESINNNATPEVKEQLKSGNMGITARSCNFFLVCLSILSCSSLYRCSSVFSASALFMYWSHFSQVPVFTLQSLYRWHE